MGWVILGIVFLVVTVWSLKGITIVEYCYEDRVDEKHVPVWALLITFVLYCIPLVGILAFIAYHVGFIVFACTKPHDECEYYIIELSNKNILHRIFRAVVRVLNKTI
nr:MAG TPA: hypothetical protein [Crassvirales sp.]